METRERQGTPTPGTGRTLPAAEAQPPFRPGRGGAWSCSRPGVLHCSSRACGSQSAAWTPAREGVGEDAEQKLHFTIRWTARVHMG